MESRRTTSGGTVPCTRSGRTAILEDEGALLFCQRHRVAPGEARGADVVSCDIRDALLREERDTVGVQALRQLLLEHLGRIRGSDQLVARGHVDPVETRVSNRRTEDCDVQL